MDKRRLLDLINEFQIEKDNENVIIIGNDDLIEEIKIFNFPNNITLISSKMVEKGKIYLLENAECKLLKYTIERTEEQQIKYMKRYGM